MGWTRTAKSEVAWAVTLIFFLNWRAEPGMAIPGQDAGMGKLAGQAAENQETRLGMTVPNTASGSTGTPTTSGISGIGNPGTTWSGPGRPGKTAQEVDRGTLRSRRRDHRWRADPGSGEKSVTVTRVIRPAGEFEYKGCQVRTSVKCKTTCRGYSMSANSVRDGAQLVEVPGHGSQELLCGAGQTWANHREPTDPEQRNKISYGGGRNKK